jgi:hypothetical protein
LPLPTQLLVLNADDDMIMLDIVEDKSHESGIRFEDLSWESYLPTLKPLGLNLLLGAYDAVTHPLARADAHLKQIGLKHPLRLSAARQTCACRVGAEIGFTADAISCFQRRGCVCVVERQHAESYLLNAGSCGEWPTMLASLYEEKENGYLQLLSEGDVSLILNCCDDYWDGHQLVPMDMPMRQRILDFCQTAAMNDIECIAFAYRPIHAAGLYDANGFAAAWSRELERRVVFLDREVNETSETDPLLPTLKRQIFLGMMTLSLQPKMVCIGVHGDRMSD